MGPPGRCGRAGQGAQVSAKVECAGDGNVCSGPATVCGLSGWVSLSVFQAALARPPVTPPPSITTMLVKCTTPKSAGATPDGEPAVTPAEEFRHVAQALVTVKLFPDVRSWTDSV